MSPQQLKAHCAQAPIFPAEVLDWITQENLWNLWVPKTHGGLELSFTQGILKIMELAKMDGSLGWTVTLCSGANYFIGNLEEPTRNKIFGADGRSILGGSGGIFGTAEKKDDGYVLSGTWRYATGAPYLTHFTLNAQLVQDGIKCTEADGSPTFRSFIVPAEQVIILPDWNTMGLKATVTHSFEVKNVWAHEASSFIYNEFYLPQAIFKIHFALFADMTLWANYVGMAQHFLELVLPLTTENQRAPMADLVQNTTTRIKDLAREIEEKTVLSIPMEEAFRDKVHREAAASVAQMTHEMISLFPYLGVKASRENEPLNQVFKDFFTATQHHIFTRK